MARPSVHHQLIWKLTLLQGENIVYISMGIISCDFFSPENRNGKTLFLFVGIAKSLLQIDFDLENFLWTSFSRETNKRLTLLFMRMLRIMDRRYGWTWIKVTIGEFESFHFSAIIADFGLLL